MEQYTVITALGKVQTDNRELAMRLCVCAINSNYTPYALMVDAANDSSDEFYIPEADCILV